MSVGRTSAQVTSKFRHICCFALLSCLFLLSLAMLVLLESNTSTLRAFFASASGHVPLDFDTDDGKMSASKPPSKGNGGEKIPHTMMFLQREAARIAHLDRATRKAVRFDNMCCGIGDRVKAMVGQIEPESQIGISWGPCASFTKNVFGHLFSGLPRVKTVDNSSCLLQEAGSFNGGEGKEWGGLTAIDHEGYVPVIASLEATPNNSKGFPSCMEGHPSWPDFPIHAISPELTTMVRDLVRGVSPSIKKRVDNFKRENNWLASDNVIALQIRYGNPNSTDNRTDAAFGARGNEFLADLQGTLVKLVKRGEQLAKRLGWAAHRLLVTTDMRLVMDTLTSVELILGLAEGYLMRRRDTFFYEFAHPLTFRNLRLNNKGSECKLEWWEDPVLDMLLLGSANALIAPSFSGFVYFPSTMVFSLQGGVVCSREKGLDGAFGVACYHGSGLNFSLT